MKNAKGTITVDLEKLDLNRLIMEIIKPFVDRMEKYEKELENLKKEIKVLRGNRYD